MRAETKMTRKTANVLLIFIMIFLSPVSMVSGDDPIVSFSFDKEGYHPGEMVMLTANLSPPMVANLTFEVHDPEDNLILVLSNQTNENGATAISFRLDNETELGDYDVYVGGNTSLGLIENQTLFFVYPGYTPLVISPWDITVSKLDTANNENISLYAMVHNLGNTTITASVSFYEGDPDTDGILIGTDVIVISPQTKLAAKMSYTATDGNHTVFVKAETEGFPSVLTSRAFTFGQGAQALLTISTGDVGFVEFEPGQEKTISVEVSCFLQTVQNVHLVVLDGENLAINASITPQRSITVGETVAFQLRVKAPELPKGKDELKVEMVIQAVGDGGIFSDAGTLNILVKENKEDQLDPMIMVIAFAVAALIIALVISQIARRSGDHKRKQIFEHVKTHPGSTPNEIGELLKMKNKTLSRHLKKLQKKGFLESRKEDNYHRFYPKETEDFQKNKIEETDGEDT